MNTDGANSLPTREPPANLEAERALIGSCLLDPYVIDEAAAFLEPGDFFRDAHAELWRHILDLREKGRDINAVTLFEALGPSKAGQFNVLDLLGEIAAGTPHAVNGRYLAEIVKAKATLRRLIEASGETLRDCYANEDTPDAICERAEQRVFAVTERDAAGTCVDASAMVMDAFTAIQARHPGQPRGVLTGFEDLDYLTDGFKPQDFVVVAARPSMGKTALACSVAVHAARSGVQVLFFSLEMSRASLGERLLACEAGLDAELLKRPWKMHSGDANELGKAIERLRALSLEIDDRPSRTVSQMAAISRRMRSRRGLGLVVIDYLSLIDGGRQRGENRQEEVARISRRLKGTARELDCPVLVVAQLNRGVESRDGHRPRLSDLRESGQIEQDADVVILLHRPEYYSRDDQPGVAEVNIAKNRNGPTGIVRLAFVQHCTRFEPLKEAAF